MHPKHTKPIVDNIKTTIYCISIVSLFIFSFTLLVIDPVQSTADNLPVLTLSDAVQSSLENNRELMAVRFDSKASKHGKSEAYSHYFPQVSFQNSMSKVTSGRYEFDMPADSPFADMFDTDQLGFSGANYINSINVSQLIFDRSVIGQIKLSKLKEEAAQWQETGQEQSVVYNTVVSYIDVLRSQELLNVQKQRLALADKQLNSATTNFEVGMRIRTDVLRAQLSRSSALRDVISAEIALQNSQVKLNQIIGNPIDNLYTFQIDQLANFNPSSKNLNVVQNYPKLFSMAKEKHPSIKVAALLVDQTSESVNIARGEFAPRASAGGRWGFNESGRVEFEEEEWALTFQIEIPIFEGGRKIAKMKRTKAQLNAQKKRYEDAIRTISTMVEQSALALQEEQRNMEISLEAEIVAKENHERFLNLYEEGLADSLDVTQALTELVEAQTDVVTTRYGYLSVYTQLLNAMGLTSVNALPYSTNDWLMELNNF